MEKARKEATIAGLQREVKELQGEVAKGEGSHHGQTAGRQNGITRRGGSYHCQAAGRQNGARGQTLPKNVYVISKISIDFNL
jgi:hypothetical protein